MIVAASSLDAPITAMRSRPSFSVASRCVSIAAATPVVLASTPPATTMLTGWFSNAASPAAISAAVIWAPLGPPATLEATTFLGTVPESASAGPDTVTKRLPSRIDWASSRASAPVKVSLTRPSVSVSVTGLPSGALSVAFIAFAQVPGEDAVSVSRVALVADVSVQLIEAMLITLAEAMRTAYTLEAPPEKTCSSTRVRLSTCACAASVGLSGHRS
jgi:hypothetical protein